MTLGLIGAGEWIMAMVTGQRSKAAVAELAVVPVLKVLSMGAIGTVLAQRRFDIIDPASTKLLSKLVFALFLPCLIFTELGAQVTFANMMNWWFIPVNVLLSTVIACAVGVVVTIICRPPRRFRRFTIVMTGMGNTGNIPLAIIGSICRTADTPLGANCQQAGVAYISFSTWISVILVYTFAYLMLEPPEYEVPVIVEGEGEISEAEESEEVSEDASDRAVEDEEAHFHPSVLETDWPGLLEAHNEDEHRVPFLLKLWRQASNISQISEDDDHDRRRVACLKEPRMMRNMRTVAERTPLQHIFQPPLIASLLAIAVGLFPKSKGILFGSDAPLGFVNGSLEILAGAMVPCIMLVLGGTLSGGPGKSELGLRTTIGVCFARLFVLPFIGIAVVEMAEYMGFLPTGDAMFKFVLFLHYTMPTAILCGAMASLRGYGEMEASSLLFWQHVLAVISVSLAIAMYINFVAYI